MSKQFTVNCPFRDRATVDGEIFFATARRIVMNDTRMISLPTPLSPTMSTLKSVGATCKATSSAWFNASQFPTILYRCLMLCSSELFIQPAKVRRKSDILAYFGRNLTLLLFCLWDGEAYFLTVITFLVEKFG